MVEAISNPREAVAWFHAQVAMIFGIDAEFVSGYARESMTHYAYKLFAPRTQATFSYGLASGLFILTFNEHIVVVAQSHNAKEMLRLREAMSALGAADYKSLKPVL